MTNEEIRATLTAAGFYCLTDDEVIDKGDYVVLKTFELNRNYQTNSATYRAVAIRGGYNSCPQYDVDDRRAFRTTVYPEKPLRIKAFLCVKDCAYTEPNAVRYVHFDYHAQLHRELHVSAGEAVGGLISSVYFSDGLYTIVQNPERDIPPSIRNPLVLRGLSLGAFGNRALALLAGRRNRLQGVRPAPTVEYKGEIILTRGNYIRNRAVLRDIGRMIADSAAGNDVDPIDLINHIEDLSPIMFARVIGSIVRAWNDFSYAELEFAGCGHVALSADVEHVHNGTACPRCFEDNYVFCEDDEEYHHRVDAYWHESDDVYRTYPEDDDDDDDTCSAVRNYSTDVCQILRRDTSIVPSAHGDFLLGIELEVVPSRDGTHDAANDTNETLCRGYAILKRDGSLPDRGFEIVTAPRGLAEHIRRFKEWKPYSTLRAWDPGCCGMHVHISSQAFTQATLGKFLEFINSTSNDGFITEIAGRHPRTDNQCQQYCQREGIVVAANPKATLDGKTNSRYRMVNTCNLSIDESVRLFGMDAHAISRPQDTIELRIFRGTLKKERLLAQIEFAHAAVLFCRTASFRALGKADFLQWLRGAAGLYPHLARWFGVRANTTVVEAQPKAREPAEI